MSDYILINGDTVNFNPAFGLATVSVKQGTLMGTGTGSVGGQPLCVDGDEKNVQVPGCQYIAGSYSIEGAGTLKIHALGGDQKAVKIKKGGKPVLLVGSLFIAEFEVTVPAMQPQPAPASPIPDPTPFYLGNGTFETKNQKWKGL